MSLSDTIPRILRAELARRGWSLTQFGERFEPPLSCDRATKRVNAAGRDLRQLESVCQVLGLRPSAVIVDAESLLPQPDAKGGGHAE
jgi:hypothetical protein